MSDDDGVFRIDRGLNVVCRKSHLTNQHEICIGLRMLLQFLKGSRHRRLVDGGLLLFIGLFDLVELPSEFYALPGGVDSAALGF